MRTYKKMKDRNIPIVSKAIFRAQKEFPPN